MCLFCCFFLAPLIFLRIRIYCVFFYILFCFSSCNSSFYECFCSIAFCFLFLFHAFLSAVVDFALVCFIRFSYRLILSIHFFFIFYIFLVSFFCCVCTTHAIIILLRKYMLTHFGDLTTYYHCYWSVSFHFISYLRCT